MYILIRFITQEIRRWLFSVSFPTYGKGPGFQVLVSVSRIPGPIFRILGLGSGVPRTIVRQSVGFRDPSLGSRVLGLGSQLRNGPRVASLGSYHPEMVIKLQKLYIKSVFVKYKVWSTEHAQVLLKLHISVIIVYIFPGSLFNKILPEDYF